MSSQNHPLPRLILAFVAGFLSVLLFHQLALLLLHSIGFAPAKLTAYAANATQPFGIPRVWSLAFWGGVWGVVLVLFVSFFRRGMGIWGTTLLFGAIAPSLVNWFIVMPLRGEPVGGGWQPNGIVTSLILNGFWGLGTILLYRLISLGLLGRKRRSTDGIDRGERERIRH
jgi:hypothetical protein